MPIALLQIFAVGFSMGLIGPCLFYCLPVALAFTPLHPRGVTGFTVGAEKEYKKSLSNILIFFSGRLAAYVLLGFLAGLSGLVLRRFIESRFNVYLGPLAGIISIILGVYILLAKENEESCRRPGGIYSSFGMFGLGFIIGLSPCAPLVTLLFEIILISKTGLEGALYGLFFGMGTFLSGFIVAAGLSRLLNIIPQRFLKSEKSRLVFKAICSLILVLFGIWLIRGLKA